MPKEDFNQYVKRLWNANTSDEIAEILKSFETRVIKDNKPINNNLTPEQADSINLKFRH